MLRSCTGDTQTRCNSRWPGYVNALSLGSGEQVGWAVREAVLQQRRQAARSSHERWRGESPGGWGERIPASLHPACRLQFGHRPHSICLVFLGSGSSGRSSVALITEMLLDSAALAPRTISLGTLPFHLSLEENKKAIEVGRVVLKGPLGALENNISVGPSPSLGSDCALRAVWPPSAVGCPRAGNRVWRAARQPSGGAAGRGLGLGAKARRASSV